MFKSATSKKRAAGLLLFALMLALFFSFNRFPKLDIVGEDLDAVTAPEAQCFQGFCLHRDSEDTFVARWVSFSVTYLRLVTVGMTFAFLVAGLAEAFLFPKGAGRSFQSGGMFSRTLRGAAAGPVMNLCSACIVPVSSAFHRRAGLEGAIAMVQGSATMNVPALAMVFFVFTPLLGISRLLLAIVGALLIGPIVAMTVRREHGPTLDVPTTTTADVEEEEEEVVDWETALSDAFRLWAKTSVGYLVRMGPIMVVAGFASGLIIQLLSPETIATYLGNDFRGILIAATFGILINVPLLFEIPLVALLLLMGMGTAPAATLLFTAAAGGPVTFWGLAKLMPRKGLAAFAGATWGVGAMGGFVVLAIGVLAWGPDADLRLAAPIVRGADVEARERLPAPPLEVPTSPLFADVTDAAGITFVNHMEEDANHIDIGAGALVLDFNADGLDDIYVTDTKGSNGLYRNNGDGTFTDVAAEAGVADPVSVSNGGCAADYDNNGYQDLYVTNFEHSRLFRNDGGTFTDVTASAIPDSSEDVYRSTGCAWGDYDMDGLLDIIVVRHRQTLAAHRSETGGIRSSDALALYHNDGDGSFTNVTRQLGDPSEPAESPPVGNVWGAGFQPVWVDLDNDGDLDLYVVNDFGRIIQPNVLWRNDGQRSSGEWRFTDVSEESGAGVAMLGMGVAIGDYDLDGFFDIFITNIGDNVLLNNSGDGLTFTEATEAARAGVGYPRDEEDTGAWIAWGTLMFDYDNDGDEDLYVIRGHLLASIRNAEEQPNVLLRNDRGGVFVEVSPSSGADDRGVGRGGVYLDYNSDGCLDLFLANLRQRARLLENLCEPSNSWIVVDPVGSIGNRDAAGARITVTTGETTQMREIRAGATSMGQNTMDAHFGLGSSAHVDSITIRWPGGVSQTITNVPVNQRLTVTEPGA